MPNFRLFSRKTKLPRADTHNEAGGRAYALGPKGELAQLAATGCFNNVFYAKAEGQLDRLKQLADQINDNEYLAKLAVYARQRAFMKDMPAALLAILAARDVALFHKVFDRVVDNGRMLRTVFQMIRSGQFGKKSLSSSVQRAFQRWLNEASVGQLLSASIGSDPSLRDVLRLARPTPTDNARRALFGWLVDKPAEKWLPATTDDLPEQIKLFERFRTSDNPAEQAELVGPSRARWDLLADTAKGPEVWAAIARNMGSQALRMNLNTLVRHGVFNLKTKPALADFVAERIANADEIQSSRQFPYQFLAAYLNASDEVPGKVKQALSRAAEIACGNVPELTGPVVIGLDVSGSMQSPVTGQRGRGATTKVRCVDAAAVFAAALFRRNPDSLIVPFDTSAHIDRIDPSDSILSLAERLAKYGGGGTDCSIPLRHVNHRHARRAFAGCVLVSDNESWVGNGRQSSTAVMTEWQQFVNNQAKLHDRDFTGPKLVCIDIQPYGSTQAPERSDILNVGGFSDAVFEIVAQFLIGDPTRFVTEVESIVL